MLGCRANSNLIFPPRREIFFLAGLIEIVISISRNGLLKACARFIIEQSEIRKKQHAFKNVHFECRMVLFYTIWKKSRLLSIFFSIECRKLSKAVKLIL